MKQDKLETSLEGIRQLLTHLNGEVASLEMSYTEILHVLKAFEGQANLDDLTGLLRRRTFFQKWEALLKECHRITLPVFAVKVYRQKEACFVLQHGIDADHKIQTPILTPRKMPADDGIRDREKTTIGTVRAFDLRFLTNATHPFIGAGGGITGFAGLSALETAGIDILSAPEE